MSSMVEMVLEGVMYDVLKRPIVVLRHDDRVLPILVGSAEAFAIANGMEKVAMPRPMTHDLVSTILMGFGARLECIQVYKLDAGTFYAYLILKQESNGTTGERNIIKIDCRPSDAIALAVRVGCPIYVAQPVLDAAGQDRTPDSDEEDEEEGPGFE